MKYVLMGSAVALLLSGAAQAQSFTHETTWGEVTMTGGVGPEGTAARAGTVTGEFRSVNADGSVVTGTIKCIGMDQPPSGGIFALHMACDTESANGTAGIAYGCNWLGERGPGTALACVGAIHGKTGDVAGRNGQLTNHFYADRRSRGTGQWFEQ